MEKNKFDKKIWGEIQLVIHILIAFSLGFTIGTCIIYGQTALEEEVVINSINQKSLLIDTLNRFNEEIDRFDKKYDELKELTIRNFETRCLVLDNYSLDNAGEDGIIIFFSDTFYKIPELFVTVNGFSYYPTLLRTQNVKQDIFFDVENVTTKDFILKISSNDEFFEISSFDRINLCFYAFVKYS